MSFNSVNPYCLERIVALAETKDVIAAEDIFDDSGIKLWAKGGRVCRELQQKLLKRKLMHPLEVALTVEDAVNFSSVVDDALLLIEKDALLARIAGSREAQALLQTMRKLMLPNSVGLLLTATREKHRSNFDHNLYTMLVSLGIGVKLQISDADARTLLIAALLHDLGEMYINPEYLRSPHRLTPKDWKYVAAHPTIGRMLIREMTKLPEAVADCVALHHERLDGSGYPNHVRGNTPNRLGAWLAVADSAAAIIARGGSGCSSRVSLAMRIVPEEFDRDAVSVVLTALHGWPDDVSGSDTAGCVERAQKAMARMDSALQAAAIASKLQQDTFTKQVLSEVTAVLGNVHKSVHATGIVSGQLDSLIDDPNVQTEINQVIREVEWRLRNMARNIYLRAESQTGSRAMTALADVIAALDFEA